MTLFLWHFLFVTTTTQTIISTTAFQPSCTPIFITKTFLSSAFGSPSKKVFKSRLLFATPTTEGGASSNTATASLLTDHAPSWETLQEQLLATPTGSRWYQDDLNREKGWGPPHADALLRRFPAKDEHVDDNTKDPQPDETDNNDANVRVTLYRDHAGWCPYCQKVWLYLELKGIPYRVQKVPMNAYGDKPAWFTRKVDGGKLPAVELDGILHVESLDIIHLLEETFPEYGPAMIPSDNDDNSNRKMTELLELELELQRAWFSLVFYPTEGEALQKSNQTFLETLARVDNALKSTDGPWFLGANAPSLVDIQYITQMERILPSVLYWKGLDLRQNNNTQVLFPHLEAWLLAFESIPAYRASRSDYYTHIMVIPSQNGPGYMIPHAKKIANQISGLEGSWSLPLNLRDDFLEPFPELNKDSNRDNPCHEAAYKVIKNHAKVVEFACRGAGEQGRPSFHAELADPYAEANEDFRQAVDVSLRHVTHALICGGTDGSNDNTFVVESPAAMILDAARKDLSGKAGNDELRENWEAYPDDDDPTLTYYWNYETGDVTWTPPTKQLDTCLAYLRDRVGVPRDMGPAAAMSLRAHLNWVIDILREQDSK